MPLDLNPRHLACQPVVLPTELTRVAEPLHTVQDAIHSTKMLSSLIFPRPTIAKDDLLFHSFISRLNHYCKVQLNDKQLSMERCDLWRLHWASERMATDCQRGRLSPLLAVCPHRKSHNPWREIVGIVYT
jgi:hypothetical protein